MKTSDSNKKRDAKKVDPKKSDKKIESKEIDGLIEKMNSENAALKKLLNEIKKELNNKK